MKNAVSREIPEELLKSGREVYQGKYYMDGKYIKKGSPKTHRYIKPQSSRLYSSTRKACEHYGAHDGMTVSSHSEFREEGCVASMVAKVLVEEMDLKGITVATTSLGNAQDLIADYIGQGKVISIQTSDVRRRIGEVTSAGKPAIPAVIHSHGGHPHVVEVGEVHIGIAFLATSTSDCWGSARGMGGGNNCGSMGPVIHNSHYVDRTVIITDTLVDSPNRPSSISAENVDCMHVADSVDNATKIAAKEARATENPRELMIAEHAAEVIVATPYFTDGSSFRIGAGSPSLAVNRFIEKHMMEKGIKMSFALGRVTSAVCQLPDKGPAGAILDAQGFDIGTIKHLAEHPKHHEVSINEHANPINKGAYVNQLDFVVLSALKIDVNFNVSVITDSGGTLRGAPGNHSDTVAGGKCCIIVTPLARGRMATVCDEVITVTMPGDCAGILVTDYGIAVNPLRDDLAQCLDAAGIGYMTIGQLRDKTYSLMEAPDALEWENQVVAVVETRGGTLLDVVRKAGLLQLDG